MRGVPWRSSDGALKNQRMHGGLAAGPMSGSAQSKDLLRVCAPQKTRGRSRSGFFNGLVAATRSP